MTIELGIFAKTFPRSSYEETLAAVSAAGFRHVHWNMSCAGLLSMLDSIDPTLLHAIRRTADERGIAIASISGTFNLIHPDQNLRTTGLNRLRVLAGACDTLGTSLITLCTGTRDATDMWRRHPENDSPAAWSDLLTSMTEAIAIADQFDITLGIEPEFGNVVNSASRARSLLDELTSPRLGIVLDPANLIEGVAPDHVETTLDEAFTLLGDRIISAHAKDRDASGQVQPAGMGIVPWNLFIQGLRQAGYRSSLVLHGLDESDVPNSVSFLRHIVSN